MGWTSTGDPYSHVGDSALTFDSEAAAKAFAEKHGWEYTVCHALQMLGHIMSSVFFESSRCLLIRSISVLTEINYK